MKHTTIISCITLIVFITANLPCFSQTLQNNYLKGGKHGGYTSAEFGSSGLKTSSENAPVLSAEILIYPNPASDLLMVHFSETLSFPSIQIITISGTVVQQTLVNEHTDEVKMNISLLPAGMYMLKIENAGETFCENFVKQ